MFFFDFALNTIDVRKARGSDMIHGHRVDSFPYRIGHYKRQFQRMMRPPCQQIFPVFVGKWKPRPDDMLSYPLYCGAMLVLFRPYFNIMDLLGSQGTFEAAFIDLCSRADDRTLSLMDNIYTVYCECGEIAVSDTLPHTIKKNI